MVNTFFVSGYWKDTNEKFEDYLIAEYEDNLEDDDTVFYYGLSEDEIKELMDADKETIHDFVITSYRRN